jgi:hypothetical protein
MTSATRARQALADKLTGLDKVTVYPTVPAAPTAPCLVIQPGTTENWIAPGDAFGTRELTLSVWCMVLDGPDALDNLEDLVTRVLNVLDPDDDGYVLGVNQPGQTSPGDDLLLAAAITYTTTIPQGE